jgi:hypothetical protein
MKSGIASLPELEGVLAEAKKRATHGGPAIQLGGETRQQQRTYANKTMNAHCAAFSTD